MTGVQTCALPICQRRGLEFRQEIVSAKQARVGIYEDNCPCTWATSDGSKPFNADLIMFGKSAGGVTRAFIEFLAEGTVGRITMSGKARVVDFSEIFQPVRRSAKIQPMEF